MCLVCNTVNSLKHTVTFAANKHWSKEAFVLYLLVFLYVVYRAKKPSFTLVQPKFFKYPLFFFFFLNPRRISKLPNPSCHTDTIQSMPDSNLFYMKLHEVRSKATQPHLTDDFILSQR